MTRHVFTRDDGEIVYEGIESEEELVDIVKSFNATHFDHEQKIINGVPTITFVYFRAIPGVHFDGNGFKSPFSQ